MNNQIEPNPEIPDDVKAMQEEYRKLNAELIGKSGPIIPVSMDSALEDQGGVALEQSQQQPQACSQPADTLRNKTESLPGDKA